MKSNILTPHCLTQFTLSELKDAITKANSQSSSGHFVVCLSSMGELLVLPELSVLLRDEALKIVYRSARCIKDMQR